MAGARLNRSDVEWLIHENDGPVKFGDDRKGHGGLDLRGANLAGADLSRLPLADSLMQQSRLEGSSFEQADLRWAFFTDSHLSETNFAGATLYKAHFDGAYLRGADLNGADLRSAWFDDRTYLDGAQLDRAFLSGCHWRGTDLVHIEWGDFHKLGEEEEAIASLRPERASSYGTAADAYGRISQMLRAQGRLPDASRFYFRSNVMRRKGLWYSVFGHVLARRPWRAISSLSRFVGQSLLELIAGYGEFPTRVILWALGVTMLFAGLYVSVGNSPQHPFDLQSAFVFSLSSLLGRGYALILPFGAARRGCLHSVGY
jgi:hypothetical protein